jgi:dipeptidyl aminopeptidase/acylaminoacyl peptidase
MCPPVRSPAMSQAVLSPGQVVVSADSVSAAFVVRTRPPKPGSAAGDDSADGVYSGYLDGRPQRIDERIPLAGPVWDLSGTRLAYAVADEMGEQRNRVVVQSVGVVVDAVELVVDGVVERLRWGADGITLLVAPAGADRASLGPGRPLAGSRADPLVVSPEGWRRLMRLDPVSEASAWVSPAGLSIWEWAPLPDGGVVAVASDDPGESGWYTAVLTEIDRAGRSCRILHTPRHQLAAPAIDPTGRWVAIVDGWASDRGLLAGDVLVLDRADGTARPIGPVGVDVTWLEWRDDGTLWLAGWLGQQTAWGRVEPSGRVSFRSESASLLDSPWHPQIAPLTGGRALAACSRVDQPPEVVILDGDGGSRPWTELNAGRASDRDLRVIELRWRSTDGATVEGLLAVPAHAETAPRPLVVDVHGGPTLVWHHRWELGLAEDLTAAGHVVLFPNPRGGVGRGQDWSRANLGDPAGLEVDDVLTGIDAAVRTGWADKTRVGAMGASYGGYLAAWLACATGRLRAAVVHAGIADLTSCWGTANNGPFYQALLDSRRPSDCSALLAGRSPVGQAIPYPTPTLITHGEQDSCVPVGQAYELRHALAGAGAPVELVIYPREGHQLQEPGHVRDASRRTVEWFTRHLR